MGKWVKPLSVLPLSVVMEIVLRVDASGEYDLSVAQVAIEFSTPQSAFANISKALSAGIPTIAGTTGCSRITQRRKPYAGHMIQPFSMLPTLV